MKKLISFLFVIMAFSSFANELEGTGYATNSTDARIEAIKDLNINITASLDNIISRDNSINSEVISLLELLQDEKIEGVKYKEKKYFLRKKYRSIISIPEDNGDLYKEKVFRYKTRIYDNVQEADTTGILLEKKEFLNMALDEIRYYEAYKALALLLGERDDFEIEYDRADIEERLNKIDTINEKPIIMEVSLTGDFPSEAYDYLLTKVNSLVSSLSENSKRKLVIANGSENVNTTFDVVVNSYYIELTEPVTYNDKEITPAKNEAQINISILSRDIEEDIFIINKTNDAIAYDFNSRKSAIFKAIDTFFKQEEIALRNSFKY